MGACRSRACWRNGRGVRGRSPGDSECLCIECDECKIKRIRWTHDNSNVIAAKSEEMKAENNQ